MNNDRLLLASDLHLTANARDEYRWGLFPWLKAQCAEHDVDTLLLLGDLTDAKDYHSASLVNRIVDAITSIAIQTPVIILRGNHDGIDPATPYFKFMSHLLSVTYIHVPERGAGKYIYFPHSKNLPEDWANTMVKTDYTRIHSPIVFMHATVGGCRAENNVELPGIPISTFEGFPGKIYSGDIHVPQRVGPVEYVGAPYPIRFGDKFTPRCLLVGPEGYTRDLHYPSIKRHKLVLTSVQLPRGVSITAGDQVKVVIQLDQREVLDWESHRKAVVDKIAALGAELCGLEIQVTSTVDRSKVIAEETKNVSDTDLLNQFCDRESTPTELRELGISLLEESDGKK